MSDTLASLSRKIEGATKLQSVVSTMKALAASSMGQYEAAVLALHDFSYSVKLGLSVCFRTGVDVSPTAGKVNPTRAVIVFGSDQGLVGQFNERVAEFLEVMLQPMKGEAKIWVVGARLSTCLENRSMPLEGKVAVPNSVEGITSLMDQVLEILVKLIDQGCGEVFIVHTRSTSAALYRVEKQRLLPFDVEWKKDLMKTPWPNKNLPELFGEPEPTLRAFVRAYLFVSLFQACAESLASENGCRFAAMQRAEKNIKSLTNDWTQNFHRLRQSSIDEELFEVVAGFNAIH